MFEALIARFAAGALLKRASGLLKAIPRPVWEALAVLGYVLALYATHQRVVHEHDTAIIAANNAQWQHKLDAEAAKVAEGDRQRAALSAQLRKVNDEQNSRIAADAGDLRLRGPGKAACPRLSGVPATPGRSQPQTAGPDAAGSSLLADDSAAVPWSWLTDRAEEHDQLRAEVQSWRAWYQQVVSAWPKNTGAAK